MQTQDGSNPQERIEFLDILLLCSTPVDVNPTLNLAEEVAGFEAEVRNSPIPIRLRRVFPPTLEQLKRELSPNALRLRTPRVFHFLGHGEDDGLWFETEEGAGRLISITQLKRELKDSPVQLALLNACWSASSRVLSLCERLTREGAVESAIGHGKPVEDRSAISFAKDFYAHLLDGHSAGRACQMAANALAERGLSGATDSGGMNGPFSCAARRQPLRVKQRLPMSCTEEASCWQEQDNLMKQGKRCRKVNR